MMIFFIFGWTIHLSWRTHVINPVSHLNCLYLMEDIIPVKELSTCDQLKDEKDLCLCLKNFLQTNLNENKEQSHQSKPIHILMENNEYEIFHNNVRRISQFIAGNIISYNIWMRQTQQDSNLCPHNFLVNLSWWHNENNLKQSFWDFRKKM